MREIKFRAWDKKSGRMLHWGSSIIMIDHQLNIHSIVNNVYMAFDVDLMQYTGLKDKNGKEIYEGDIIEHCDDRYIVPKFIPLSRFYEAENILGGHHEPSDDWVSMSDVDWEVIGNVYENPELLTQLS